MQTLHLRFRDLRAISLGQSPGRWPSPSLRAAATWKGAPPLPNHPRPTLAVGSHPAMSRQRLARCPTLGAGLPLASPLREVRVGANAHPDKPVGADTNRVCPQQTTSELTPYPALHEAGDLGTVHWQARTSEVRCTPSAGLSFPLVPRRGKARSIGEKTADPVAHIGACAGVGNGALWRRSRHGRGEGAWQATISL